jgi:transposase-like protein
LKGVSVGDIRKHHPPALKAKIAADAISGNLTQAQLSSKYGVSAQQISKWKTEVMDLVVHFFSKKSVRGKDPNEFDTKLLLELLGKKEAEIDFLKKKLGLLASSRRKG